MLERDPYWQLVVHASAGSMVLYIWGGAVRDYLDNVFPSWPAGPTKEIASFLVYVAVGGFVGVLAADPFTGRQAFFSGLAWPVLLGLIQRRGV